MENGLRAVAGVRPELPDALVEIAALDDVLGQVGRKVTLLAAGRRLPLLIPGGNAALLASRLLGRDLAAADGHLRRPPGDDLEEPRREVRSGAGDATALIARKLVPVMAAVDGDEDPPARGERDGLVLSLVEGRGVGIGRPGARVAVAGHPLHLSPWSRGVRVRPSLETSAGRRPRVPRGLPAGAHRHGYRDTRGRRNRVAPRPGGAGLSVADRGDERLQRMLTAPRPKHRRGLWPGRGVGLGQTLARRGPARRPPEPGVEGGLETCAPVTRSGRCARRHVRLRYPVGNDVRSRLGNSAATLGRLPPPARRSRISRRQ